MKHHVALDLQLYARLKGDCQSVVDEQEVLEIQVTAGWKEGTRITYPGKGDALPGRPPQVGLAC